MSEILQHREAGVLTLTFNRLDKKNAITTAMYGSTRAPTSRRPHSQGMGMANTAPMKHSVRMVIEMT